MKLAWAIVAALPTLIAIGFALGWLANWTVSGAIQVGLAAWVICSAVAIVVRWVR